MQRLVWGWGGGGGQTQPLQGYVTENLDKHPEGKKRMPRCTPGIGKLACFLEESVPKELGRGRAIPAEGTAHGEATSDEQPAWLMWLEDGGQSRGRPEMGVDTLAVPDMLGGRDLGKNLSLSLFYDPAVSL